MTAKCSDCCYVSFAGRGEVEGYVPGGIGIGGGDYIEFKYCLDCGQIIGHFPISDEVVAEFDIEEEEE